MLSPNASGPSDRTCDLCGASPVVAYATGLDLDDMPSSVDLCERCTLGLVLDSIAHEVAQQVSAADLYSALDERVN